MTDRPIRLAYLGDPNSIHVRRWMAYFAERGHVVSLLDGFGAEIQPGLDPRIRVVRYRAGRSRIPGLGTWRTRRALRSALTSVGADILHAHFVRRFGWQAAAARFHPLVVSGWGSDVLVGRLRTRRVRWRDRRTLRSADLVTVTNAFMRDAIIANGAQPGRVALVQHGVDTVRFHPGAPDPSLLSRHDLSDRRIVLSPRAIRPLYRHQTVLAAFARLDPDARLVMSALDADPATLAAIRRQARELNIEDRLLVLDRIDPDELPDWYRAASVVVSVPESDSFPVTLQEAMATGAPLVVGDLPPTRSVLGVLVPESLVPIGDADATAQALRRSLDAGSDERGRIASVLRDWAVREADYETNMARMETLYRELIGR
ncbi:MAG TPA: glycosyltransferase [Candidatus Limnocylindria bacterium]|nr:glycosyltransferase [Candidatus Limnocylindria bacterium]